MKMHNSCLRFSEMCLSRYNLSLSRLVVSRMGVGTRLVIGQHQVIYAVQGDDVRKLPSWVQNLTHSERNRIW